MKKITGVLLLMMHRLHFVLPILFCFFTIPINSIHSQEISFLFMGDIMGHGPQIRSAFQESKNKYDYREVFNPLEEIISSVDFAIANLEVTLAGPPFMGYPQFSSPDELAVACKNSGMDVLVTANNHSCDRKNNGIIRTVKVLDSLEILHTGTFKNEDTRDRENLLILSKEGLHVGLLNYTYGTNGIPFTSPTFVNMLDSNLIIKDIESAKQKGLDKLIVFVHWGSEYQDFPNKYQTKFNQLFYRMGVDVVIGSHPHVLQPMIYKKEKKKEFLTVFSLGNFVSNQREERKDGGAMFRLSFQKKGNNIKISKKEYLLTWVNKSLKKDKYHYEILPCSKPTYNEKYFSNIEDFNQMQLFLNNSREHLQINNEGVHEGAPYGYATIKQIKSDKVNLPSFRNKETLRKKRKKRKNES